MSEPKHYDVVMPLRVSGAFTYRAGETISRGARVLVQFGARLCTGVVWGEADKVPDKVKDVLEVIDSVPLIPENILQLADWTAKYYRIPLGIALFAMIPGALGVHLQTRVRKRDLELSLPLSEAQHELLKLIPGHDWNDLSVFSKSLPGLHRRLEELEALGYIEIWHTFDAKVKPRVANFVVLDLPEILPELTVKQHEALTILQTRGHDFPLASVAGNISYAIIKALRKKELIHIVPRELPPQDMDFHPDLSPAPVLIPTDEQQTVIARVTATVRAGKFGAYLLHGITGSGKTEVYLRIIREAHAQGRTALLLVPEIALTPQMVERLFRTFGGEIAVLHSHLSERSRLEQWRRIRSGACKTVVGARSALFAPLEHLGVIIVDEEHETSYKQESDPRYHARDLALVRGRMEKAAVVLGSATPSLESWHNVTRGKLELLQLTHRPVTAVLPTVRIVDLRGRKDNHIVTPELQAAISAALKRGEQSILFLNRRGYASFVQCTDCGRVFRCPNCDISLNYHSHDLDLVCHYCGYRLPMPRRCPDCGSFLFSFGAPGTQQAEQQLKTIFPEARILRLDSDTSTGKDSYDRMFERMKSGEIDILLGTQMIAKGLDFPNVTLVGVLSADVSINLPDFRAAERTFQLLTQVAGRAGRSNKPGEVIVQTYSPDYYAVRLAAAQDYLQFAQMETEVRQQLRYPPFSRIARLLYTAPDEYLMNKTIDDLLPVVETLRRRYAEQGADVLGPVPAPFARLQNRYRFHIVVKAESVNQLSRILDRLERAVRLKTSVKCVLDIDPGSML